MYDFISGRLVDRSPGEVVIENAGIGYQLSVSGATSGRLPASGEVTLYVTDMVRDDHTVLFGFASREERSLFRVLLGVSRVGPAMALALLSALEPAALASAVDARDIETLGRVKGVGRRTAERLCVDLKGRLGGVTSLPGALTDRAAAVTSALVALGYNRGAAIRVADTVCSAAPPDATLEDLVRLGLARVSGTTQGAG